MKTPDMAKENNFVLREAAKAACDGYYDHLAAGGEGDPAEERWIEALTAGADAITQVAVLEARIAQTEKERDELLKVVNGDCYICKNAPGMETEMAITSPCRHCIHYRYRYVYRTGDLYTDNWQWRGVCEENTEEDK